MPAKIALALGLSFLITALAESRDAFAQAEPAHDGARPPQDPTPTALPAGATEVAHTEVAGPAPAGATEVANTAPPVADVTVKAPHPAPRVQQLVREGRYREALADLDAALRKNPKDDESRLMRARLLYWTQRNDLAELEVRAVLSRHPSDLEAQELLAQVRLAQGDPAGALALYRGLQAAGDGRPEVQQRIVDLLLVLDDTAGVDHALRLGGRLTDEQHLQYAKARHPWSADAGTGLTLNRGELLARFDGAIGYRFSRKLTVLAGVHLDKRPLAADTAARVEAYMNYGALDLMAHVSSAPARVLLPGLDLRLDGSVQLNHYFAAFAYVRFASYKKTDSLSIGPTLMLTLGNFTVQPGFLAVRSTPRPGTWDPTLFLKLRWQTTARTGLMLWSYFGQDTTFFERFGPTGSGITVMAGVEHWWSGRWGTRLSASGSQQAGVASSSQEISITMRGRF